MNFKYLYIDEKKIRKKERIEVKNAKDTRSSKIEHRMR